MKKITITPGTKKARLLEWMSQGEPGVHYSEIQRFICEMNDLDYDEMVSEPIWKQVKSECGNYTDWNRVGTKKVRKHKGIWATNLCSGDDPILKNYCYKSGGKWYVNHEVKLKLHIREKKAIMSSLEQEFKSDEIPNNSKVVERKIICMTVDGKDIGEQTMTSNPDQRALTAITNIAGQIFAVNRALEEASEMIEKLTVRQNELAQESVKLKESMFMWLEGKSK